MRKQKTIPHQDLTYRINGAAMRVHNRLGPGHKEGVYQHDLTTELRSDGLKVREEYPLGVFREEGTFLGYLYVDHIVEDCVVVEAKALSHLLTGEETAQVVTYLAATALPVGLLLNFGRRKLEFHRILPPKKLEGWENRLIRYLWQPDNPSAAAEAFAKRGIEPGRIIVPSSDIVYPAQPPTAPIRHSDTTKPAPDQSDHPLPESVNRPSVNPIGRRQSVDSAILNQLFALIQDRKTNRPANSYTTHLFEAGPAEIAKKLGEETIEIIVAAAEQDRDQIIYESADLIYHLLVLLAEHDVDIAEVYAELEKRRK